MSATKLNDYTQRVTFTFMVGVYLGINAIRDLYLLVEGPDCAHMKTQYVQGNHDWLSTLTSVSGFHRIANTALHPSQMSGSREKGILDALKKMGSHPAVPAVVLTTMPMAAITAADYERLTLEASNFCKKPMLHVPGKSLSGDWLDGYAEVLNSLASQLDLSGGDPKPENVAIVGNLFDRNEADCTANILELERMIEALGLRLVSTWLSGSDFESLRDVRQAGTILSLPYGRKAAKRIARRTGAKLLELPLPFGFGPTEAFVEKLALEFGRPELGKRFVDKELARLIPRLEWVIPFVMQGKRIGYIGEPNLVNGLLDMAKMVGAKLQFAVITNRPEVTKAASITDECETLIYPKMKSLVRYLMKATQEDSYDLLISHNMGILSPHGAVLEFGFPSSFRHSLYERPFLGFNGALAFLDLVANSLRMQEAEVARQHLAVGFRSGHR